MYILILCNWFVSCEQTSQGIKLSPCSNQYYKYNSTHLHTVPEIETYIISYINYISYIMEIIFFLSSTALYVCCVAWLGNSYVSLLGYSPSVLKLPNSKVSPIPIHVYLVLLNPFMRVNGSTPDFKYWHYMCYNYLATVIVAVHNLI